MYGMGISHTVLIQLHILIKDTMKWYKVYDKYGGFLRSFRTWDEANKYRIIMNRPDWIIGV